MSTSFLTSFAGLFGCEAPGRPTVHAIRIPLIQRDYAQGRAGEAVGRIRAAFVTVLIDAVSGGAPVTLDFVYGDVKDGILEPLDGQQRLTTLFLLHVVLAHDAGVDARAEPWRAFSYATRASARLFCERIVQRPPPPGEPLSRAWLTDQPWYLPTWRYDPTIQSMLVMLEALRAGLEGVDARAAWARLVDPAHPAIAFHLLPMAELELGDQLYIKMNSRGKPLTPFENFKARFEQQLERSCPEPRVRELALKIDGAWSDLLWPYRGDDDVIDDEFLRYFHLVTELVAWGEPGVQADACKRIGDTPVEALAEQVYAPRDDSAEERARVVGNVDALIAAFDGWVGEASVASWFGARFALRPPPVATGDTDRVVISGVRGTEREPGADLFHAACRTYGTRAGGRRTFGIGPTLLLAAALWHRLGHTPEFQRRARVLRNLIEASASELRMERMAWHLSEVATLIEAGALEPHTSFNVSQRDEEATKMALLDAHPQLRQPVWQLEDHPLLKGCLTSFVLEPARLAARARTFLALFDGRDRYPALSAAMLAVGDYSIPVGGRFFLFGAPRTDGPWRDVLTGWPRFRTDRTREVLCALLDRVEASGLPPDDALDRIRAEYLAEEAAHGRWSWRTYLVKYDAMREGARGRYVGWEGSMGPMLCMLWGERVSGDYRDAFLYAMWRAVPEPERAHIKDEWFRGYEHNARWLPLLRSGAAVRCVLEGLQLSPPVDPARHAAFYAVCAAHGAGPDGLLPIGRVETADGLADTEDRVARGAALLTALVRAGF